jgi:hypothetical protein
MSRSLFEHMSDLELGKVAEEMADIYERAMAPSTDQVIAKMIHYGCPRGAAVQQMRHPGLALYGRQFYVDAEDAERGEPEAKARLEQTTEAWARQNEQIARQQRDHVLD